MEDIMKDDLGGHLCERCSREDADRDKIVADRLDYWKTAQRAIMAESVNWPEDGKPTPSDVLNLAGFLAQELGSS